MTKRAAPLLVREDPGRDPLAGNIKVTREDWLNLARDVLVHEGAGELRVMTLAGKLSVSRSSFYWYFKNRKDLLAALLDDWDARNTRSIIDQCALPARNINEAVSNFFRCFVSDDLFDPRLDFAVREWSRRDPAVRARIDAADQERLKAVIALFVRHGYPEQEADARARIVYFMQIGYHALELRESIEERLGRAEEFLRAFTGVKPDKETLETFRDYAIAKDADL